MPPPSYPTGLACARMLVDSVGRNPEYYTRPPKPTGSTSAEARHTGSSPQRDSTEYFAKIAARAISSLQAISDEAFARGLGALERHCRETEDRPIDEPVEIFLFGAATGRR